jgi:hypothetical protein
MSIDKLNKMLDSHIGEEKIIINPKRKRNDDDSTVSDAHV